MNDLERLDQVVAEMQITIDRLDAELRSLNAAAADIMARLGEAKVRQLSAEIKATTIRNRTGKGK